MDGERLQFEKQMIKNQFEKEKKSNYIWGGHEFEWEIAYISLLSFGIF